MMFCKKQGSLPDFSDREPCFFTFYLRFLLVRYGAVKYRSIVTGLPPSNFTGIREGENLSCHGAKSTAAEPVDVVFVPYRCRLVSISTVAGS